MQGEGPDPDMRRDGYAGFAHALLSQPAHRRPASAAPGREIAVRLDAKGLKTRNDFGFRALTTT